MLGRMSTNYPFRNGCTLLGTSAHLNCDWARLLVTESDERFAADEEGASTARRSNRGVNSALLVPARLNAAEVA